MLHLAIGLLADPTRLLRLLQSPLADPALAREVVQPDTRLGHSDGRGAFMEFALTSHRFVMFGGTRTSTMFNALRLFVVGPVLLIVEKDSAPWRLAM